MADHSPTASRTLLERLSALCSDDWRFHSGSKSPLYHSGTEALSNCFILSLVTTEASMYNTADSRLFRFLRERWHRLFCVKGGACQIDFLCNI
jgi:hypothetical protein